MCTTATARRRRRQFKHDPRYQKHLKKATALTGQKGRKQPKKGSVG